MKNNIKSLITWTFNFHKKKQAFTLIELLIAMVLFAIVGSMAISSFVLMSESREKGQALNDMRFSVENELSRIVDDFRSECIFYSDEYDFYSGENYLKIKDNNNDILPFVSKKNKNSLEEINVYKLEDGAVSKKKYNCTEKPNGSLNCGPLTTTTNEMMDGLRLRYKITDLKFYVFPEENKNNTDFHPSVKIVISAQSELEKTNKITLQTTISSRCNYE